LTLLRAPHSPDPRTDVDRHRLTYSLAPGVDLLGAADAGYALNLPLRLAPSAAPLPALVHVDNPAVRVEAVKLADARSGDVVLRLYESRGGRAPVLLRPGFPVTTASEVDLLERPLRAGQRSAGLAADPDGALRLTLRPFQVVTLRLQR